MTAAVVYVIIGALLVVMALTRTVLKRLPLTTSLLYLVVGILLGPFFLGMIQLDPVQQPALFETATEVALLSTSAMQASQGLSMGTILLFPLLFTVGMLTVDATDGVLMLRVYGWAFVKPFRKLYYNMMLTLTSTLLALVIAAIGISSLLQETLHLQGSFWAMVQGVHENYTSLGYVIIGVFTLSWIGSEAFYRIKGYDALDAAS